MCDKRSSSVTATSAVGARALLWYTHCGALLHLTADPAPRHPCCLGCQRGTRSSRRCLASTSALRRTALWWRDCWPCCTWMLPRAPLGCCARRTGGTQLPQWRACTASRTPSHAGDTCVPCWLLSGLQLKYTDTHTVCTRGCCCLRSCALQRSRSAAWLAASTPTLCLFTFLFYSDCGSLFWVLAAYAAAYTTDTATAPWHARRVVSAVVSARARCCRVRSCGIVVSVVLCMYGRLRSVQRHRDSLSADKRGVGSAAGRGGCPPTVVAPAIGDAGAVACRSQRGSDSCATVPCAHRRVLPLCSLRGRQRRRRCRCVCAPRRALARVSSWC
jgi:hypothetical protein